MERWYLSPLGAFVLGKTDGGKLLFVWEALYNDGKPACQFEEHVMMRAVKDASFVPDLNLAISTSSLDRERVMRFSLIPTAFAKQHTPLQSIIECRIRLDLGERFIAHWLTDDNATLKMKISRHIIGVETKTGDKFLTIVSPSGKITLSSTVHISYEGE
jgi:hypothetical protein